MENYKRQTITPALTVSDGEAAIAFYQKVLGAQVDGEIMRGPEGEGIMHAELRLGDMKFFLNSECAQMGVKEPAKYGGSGVGLYVYVSDTDRTYRAALALGATSVMEPADQFWGDRSACVSDPWGHRWNLATAREELTMEEIKKRAEEMFAKK